MGRYDMKNPSTCDELPGLLRPFFWDVDFRTLSIDGSSYFIISRLMEHGDEAAPVPEPSTILLVGTGLLGIIGFGRKRLNKKA